jgi:RNA polymerase sigma factor (sigma-70 family)
MVSEGVLKVYELLEKDPETHPANLYREARRRMYDYLNFDCNGLSVPASDTARTVSRTGDVGQGSSWSQEATENLKRALSADWGEYDDDMTDGNHATPEEILIDKQTNQVLTNIINKVLTEDEAELVILRYFEDATQEEVADLYGLTRQGVSLREKKALRKLKFQVCNIL